LFAFERESLDLVAVQAVTWVLHGPTELATHDQAVDAGAQDAEDLGGLGRTDALDGSLGVVQHQNERRFGGPCPSGPGVGRCPGVA
jgi:hypothetical protein